MARVLVVGSNIREENNLLRRLRQVACLPADGVLSCLDLDKCDLLVIKDTPALRNAARHMVRGRPSLQLWMQDDAGQLHDGLAATAPILDNIAIERALQDMHMPSVNIDVPVTVAGSKELTRTLRRRLQEKSGHVVLSAGGQPQLLVDFESDQAVLLPGCHANGPALAEQLGSMFDQLALQELSPDQYLGLAGILPKQSLRPILWQMAQYVDVWGDLDLRLGNHAQVRLLRWPDFRVLARQHDGFRLCSLLLKKSCTLDECGRLLDLDADVVKSFMRSAYLCGYAIVEAPPAAEERQTAEPKKGAGALLARMWRSVRAKTGA